MLLEFKTGNAQKFDNHLEPLSQKASNESNAKSIKHNR